MIYDRVFGRLSITGQKHMSLLDQIQTFTGTQRDRESEENDECFNVYSK